ncbi:MAG: hypothetical protein ACI32C_05405 [Candidatus Enteromonas sp.]
MAVRKKELGEADPQEGKRDGQVIIGLEEAENPFFCFVPIAASYRRRMLPVIPSSRLLWVTLNEEN